MLFVLSGALAKKWKIDMEALERLPDVPPAWLWRLDVMPIGNRKSNIICTNVASYYSLAFVDLKRMPMKETMLQVINRVGDAMHEYGMPAEYVRASLAAFEFCKYTDRHLIGVMNQLRVSFEWAFYSPHPSWKSLNDLEATINDGVAGGPDYVQPSEAFRNCIDETMKRLPKREDMMHDLLFTDMLRDRNN
jgi:hypothetical protein